MSWKTPGDRFRIRPSINNSDHQLCSTLTTKNLALIAIVLLSRPLPGNVVINEVLAFNRFTSADEDGDRSDWLELYNAGDTDVNLGGYWLSDNPANPTMWPLPAKILKPANYALVWCSGKDRTGLPADLLQDPSVPFFPTFVTLDADWHYLVSDPQGAGPPPDWQTEAFDDSTWPTGKAGFGYREPGIMTPIPEDSGAVFLRHRFQVLDQDLLSVVLQIRVDDGFVAYLNGTRVTSLHFPEDEEPNAASLATRSNSAAKFVRLDISEHRDLLQPGENVLAIALVNRRINTAGSDIFVEAQLGSVPFYMHSNFRLDQGGETISLRSPDGQLKDQLSFESQMDDQSFGRFPDGANELFYQLNATPLTKNVDPVDKDPLLVAPLRFNVPSGFYDQPFDLEISTATTDAELRYIRGGAAPGQDFGTVYTTPLHINKTTVVRVLAYRDGLKPTEVATRTYIFLDDIVRQDHQATLAMGLPQRWGSSTPVYGINQRVVGQGGVDDYGGKYARTIRDDLQAIPSVSIAINNDDMFGSTGVYVRSMKHGVEWERPMSMEIIYPDGRKGFQVNAGVRVQGGASRDSNLSKKHSLRILFKRQYGPTRLNVPLFSGKATDSFDQLILRAGFNDAFQWSVTRTQASYIRDSFHRRTVLAMGGVASHERWVHLYINGAYWGIHNLVERPNADFAASYFGGEKESWDSRSHRGVSSGEPDAWNAMNEEANAGLESNEAYFRIQGLNADGTENPLVEPLIDMDSLITDLLAHFYSGAGDWPTNNYWVARRREESTGFKFFIWDTELSLGALSPLEENRTKVGTGPVIAYRTLRQNPEFQLRFADHVHRHLFNGGALFVDRSRAQWDPEHPERNVPASRWAELATTLRGPVVAESARWGYSSQPHITRDEFWDVEINRILTEYFPFRHEIVLGQLEDAGLYPKVASPVFQKHGGRVPGGFPLFIRSSQGETFFTRDGSDPRLVGGNISPTAERLTAVHVQSGVVLERSASVRARTLVDSEWSALNEAHFLVDDQLPLRITEIHFHPPAMAGEDEALAAEREFIELRNISDQFIDISEARLTSGVEFSFADSEVTRLRPGGRVVVVRDLEAFSAHYDSLQNDTASIRVAGEYTGELNNAGEQITLVDGDVTILDFTYSDDWYKITDGFGASLVIVDDEAERATWGQSSNWEASQEAFGSPGRSEEFFTATGGSQRQGDSNQDGRLDLSDAVSLILRIVGLSTTPLPCEGKTVAEGANRVLFDIDANNQIDTTDVLAILFYLFGTATPPALGSECTPIVGCPDTCR